MPIYIHSLQWVGCCVLVFMVTSASSVNPQFIGKTERRTRVFFGEGIKGKVQKSLTAQEEKKWKSVSEMKVFVGIILWAKSVEPIFWMTKQKQSLNNNHRDETVCMWFMFVSLQFTFLHSFSVRPCNDFFTNPSEKRTNWSNELQFNPANIWSNQIS